MEQADQQQELPPQQQPQGQIGNFSSGITAPNGRRINVAHRRNPSDMTPLVAHMINTASANVNTGAEHMMPMMPLQPFDNNLFAQQQQHLASMNMMPGQFNPMQQMAGMGGQGAFQFPGQQMQQPQAQQPQMSNPSFPHRRNNSAVPNMPMGNMGMGPPPAPSAGASGGSFGAGPDPQSRDYGGDGGRGRGRGRGAGPQAHQRRHSLVLGDAVKAAEIAQQKRTTGFQFPASGGEDEEKAESPALPALSVQDEQSDGNTAQSPLSAGGLGGGRGRGSHGRSQSMAAGNRAMGRAGFSPENDPFPPPSRRGGHNRSNSRSLADNWRQAGPGPLPAKDGTGGGTGTGGGGGPQGGFQPSHRARNSVSEQQLQQQQLQQLQQQQLQQQQSMSNIGAFQYPGGPQMMQLPNQLLMNQVYPNQMQLQAAMAAAQMNGGNFITMPPGQPHPGPMGLQQLQAQIQMQQQQQQVQQQQAQQQQAQHQQHQPQNQQPRKTLFTPYLPQATLPALLAGGQLVSGVLRVNKKNRSDAYVATHDGLLDADIFICGSKDRNRALEGDLVAVELLDVDEVWIQKRDKEEKKRRKDITDTHSGSGGGVGGGGGAEDGGGAPDHGLRRRGSLRQRPTQKKNDDVEVEGQSLLLVEEEEINDELKPLYAGHVVAVIERIPGQMFSGTLGVLRPSSQATKEKQEAERAARDGSYNNNNNNSGRYQDRPKIVWFKPTDKRVPLIAIPTEQAPRDFVERHPEYADQIFVACIKRWPITSLHPFGTMVETLGRMGDLKVETAALLRDNNFGSDEFSEAVLRSVGLLEWSVAKEDEVSLATRRDYRAEKTFTLDYGADAAELGNAIHVKMGPDGKMEIGIHVPDVAHFVRSGSLVDREAKKRGVAVQLVNRFCAMLPSKIASDVCSLIPDEDRFTFSVVFRVNPHDGSVAEDDCWVGKSIIRSTAKLSLEEMDAALAGDGGGQVSVDLKDIQILHAVSQKFREARLGAQGEPIAPLRLLRLLDDENLPVRHNLFESTPATELVEELMHKTNAHVADLISQAFPGRAVLRRQAGPNPRRLQTFVDRMRALGYEVDPSSSGALQSSLFRIDDVDVRKGMETLLVKSLQRAKYFIAGKATKPNWAHYSLNLPVYTHFTGPTRRYIDLMVHRQLEAALSESRVEYGDEYEVFMKTVESCNNKKDSAQNAQDQSIHIESCRAMDRLRQAEPGGELISEGIVLCVYESAFDVLIPEFGFEKRVHCDQLPLKKAEFRSERRVLELYWEKGVSSSAYVPEDERPKPSASLRMSSNEAAAARRVEEADKARREREEATRKQTDTTTISTVNIDALFDDDDDSNGGGGGDDNGSDSDLAGTMAGASLAERPTQSVPGSPARASLASSSGGGAGTGTAASMLHRTRSESKVATADPIQPRLTNKEKYLKLFTLSENGGEYIQFVKEMSRVPIILKTDLSKSPPCLTIRSLNPYAL